MSWNVWEELLESHISPQSLPSFNLVLKKIDFGSVRTLREYKIENNASDHVKIGEATDWLV